MPLLGIDHVELYVGNAIQAAYWFTHALGFRETAYAGLETGIRDRSSHVLEQGRVRFVLTAPLLGTSEIARHVGAHGDGVQGDRALGPRRRARLPVRGPARRPRRPRAVGGVRRATARVRMATVATYGETLHTFVERNGYTGAFLPGYAPTAQPRGRRGRACSPASTTWSATSSSAASTSGSATTSASSG